MNNRQHIINYPLLRWIDHSKKTTIARHTYTAIDSFAVDDAITQSVGDELSPPTMRLWTHPNTVVLGIPDTRLPHLEKGVKQLVHAGYYVIVRNSGGLAVVLDENILNISLILPDAKKLSIHDGYEVMLQFVRDMFSDLTNDIEAYEIVDSYCPGDYDLSIEGKKFAGISQRRIKGGVAIQIYLDVNGNSEERAKLIRKFYDESMQGEKTSFSYPMVDHRKMSSLSTLLQKNITMEEVKKLAYNTFSTYGHLVTSNQLIDEEEHIYSSRYKLIKKRNEALQEIQTKLKS